MKTAKYHVHSDNIVEFERLVTLLSRALEVPEEHITGPLDSLICPRFVLQSKIHDIEIELVALPGYSRWNCDILGHLRSLGAPLREAADVILSRVENGSENPVLALEFCGALPAGNQAWQRSGRAFSYSAAGVLYFYIAEIGGYELDSDRKRKAARLPNPAVPFSYVTNTADSSAASLPVFVMSPGANPDDIAEYAAAIGETDMHSALRAVILGHSTDGQEGALKQRALAFVSTRAGTARAGTTLTPLQWKAAYNAGESGTQLPQYLMGEKPIKWSKTAYIDGLTDSARALMELAARHARGLTSSDLPICLIPPKERVSFTSEILKLYGKLPETFENWLKQDRPLTVCWVMGFKPKGDDARPDRGLPPLTRMLVGLDQDVLTVVYGPAPAASWPMLLNSPGELAARNGLWEAVFAASDALLIDSATAAETLPRGFVKEHWSGAVKHPHPPCVVTPVPTSFGEQDVDTVLHLLFSRLAGNTVFEGMCNPPGGDWSGLSLLSANQATEHRWLTLPRVGKASAKRPDHVFQFFGVTDKPIVMIVESKEHSRTVEEKVGTRLSDYVQHLLESPSSVHRKARLDAQWTHSEQRLTMGDFTVCTAIAFLSASPGDLKSAGTRAEADLSIGVSISASGSSVKLAILAQSSVGEVLARHLAEQDFSKSGVTIEATYT